MTNPIGRSRVSVSAEERPVRWTPRWIVGPSLAILAVASFLPPAGAGGQRAPVEPVAWQPCAKPAKQVNSLFRLDGPGWIGGDGAQSIRVRDRSLWIFADSFLGTVVDDGAHAHPGCRLIRSAALLEAPGGLRMIDPPGSMIPTEKELSRWYWPGDGVYEDGEVRMPVYTVRSFAGLGPWNFEITGVSVARLSWPGLELRGIVHKPYRGILWGLSLYAGADWTYIYGWADGEQKLYVARARDGALDGRWTYRTQGRTWSRRASKATPVLTGVTTGSVVPYREKFLLVSQRPWLSGEIAMFVGATPYGPFDAGRTVYETPESGGISFTYGATVHPWGRGDDVLIGYSVNGWELSDLHADAALYRPRFVRLDRSCLLGSS